MESTGRPPGPYRGDQEGQPEGMAKSKECYEQALAIDPTCALAWYGLAFYFGLGEIEKGFDWLQKASEDHQSFLLQLSIHPFLDPLRSHPRYKALLRKMKLDL